MDLAVRCAAAREAAFDQSWELAGADPEAVWQWAFTELVSTGLFLLCLGHHEEAETFLAVAGKLAAATANGQLGRVRRAPPADK